MPAKNNFTSRFIPRVSVLTAGRDRHYSVGLANALDAAGIDFDFIASDELETPELLHSPHVRFLNLRGDQSVDASLPRKMYRALAYYFRLLAYAVTTRSKIFHILWNNKFELFDRTLLMAFYKVLGKRIAFTAHNVNAGARDGCDSILNRASLRFQYRLCDNIFVHTQKMKDELVSEFKVSPEKIVIIPFGLNNAVPNTDLTTAQARQRLGLLPEHKVILFFGNIAPYKGLQFLVEAFGEIVGRDPLARLVIAGRPKGPPEYWRGLRDQINAAPWRDKVIQKIEYISDADTEVYFKAADATVLPYVHIFQSGVLFLAFSFGLPVIAADVGSFKEEVVEGRNGFMFKPGSSGVLACALEKYFQSDLYRDLETNRCLIQKVANEKYSWSRVAAITIATYSGPLHGGEHPGLGADFAGQKP